MQIAHGQQTQQRCAAQMSSLLVERSLCRDHVRVIASLLYKMTRRLLSVPAVLLRSGQRRMPNRRSDHMADFWHPQAWSVRVCRA